MRPVAEQIAREDAWMEDQLRRPAVRWSAALMPEYVIARVACPNCGAAAEQPCLYSRRFPPSACPPRHSALIAKQGIDL